MGAAGFHQLGSEFADARIAHVRDKLARGETVYLAGLGAPGTHNSGLALVEVTQAGGPRLIVNNEEERFSGNKHTTEYPKLSIDAVVATLREMGRDIGDIDAWLTSWDYPTLAGTLARSVIEELPQSFKLVRTTEAAGFDGRRLDQMTRTPKILARQLGLTGRVPLICLPHHDNHAWFSYAASPFADDGEPTAVAVLDGTGDQGSISLYVGREWRDAPPLLQRQHVRFTRRVLQRDFLDAGRLDLAVQRGPLYGRRRMGRHGPRQQSLLCAAAGRTAFRQQTAKSGSTARWPTGTAIPSIIPTSRR